MVPPHTGRTGPRPTRRAVLLATGGLLPLAGCLSAPPSGGGVAFESVEVDDGAVFEPGLADELELDYYAGVLTGPAGAEHFDHERLTDAGEAFLAETDLTTHLLGVFQVAGVNSSRHFEIATVQLTPVNMVVVVSLRDEPPHSDDRVISTLLVRVTKRPDSVPKAIWVELGIDGRDETIAGDPVN